MFQALHKITRHPSRPVTKASTALLAIGLALSIHTPLAYAAPKVAASIKPVHSLVASIMQGAGEPYLIQNDSVSPHDYALKPSQAEYINEADLIFWMGPEIESYLERATNSIANKSASFELGKEAREKFEREEKNHNDEHADESNKEHAEEHSEGHKDEHSKDHKDEHGEGHRDEHEHHHDHADLHIWLDPVQASAIAKKIANALSKIDPQNAALYQENYKLLSSRLSTLTNELASTLKPLTDKHFIVYHDAYGHFQHRFGLENVHPLTINTDVSPGAATLREAQELIAKHKIKCAFAEPQFSANRVETLATDYNLTTAILDPIGAGIEPGPDLYFQLLNSLADNLNACLSKR